MILMEWAPIGVCEQIPPFGDALTEHILAYKGERRQASCSAWMLLYRILLDHKLGFGTVIFGVKGKPFFSDCPIFFSISHTKGICAAAVSDVPVGIDVERCRDRYNKRMISRSLTEQEKKNFDGDFTRIWCRKEAASKISGEGLNGFPENIDSLRFLYYENKLIVDQTAYWLTVAIDL